MIAFGAKHEAVQPFELPDRGKAVAATREKLVDIALVADVKKNFVLRSLKNPVEGNGQFDDAEVGPQMAAGLGKNACEFLANFLSKERHRLRGEGFHVGGRGDPGKD